MSQDEKLRWGILGTGMIANKFAAEIPDCGRAELAAVASRQLDKARAFVEKHSGTPLGSYEELLENSDVDAIYVSLPNGMHREWTLAALEAGKHVLCEKPLAATARQVEQLFDAAESADRCLMEAFMYRCFPRVQRAIELVRGGALGEVRLIRSNFSFGREADRRDARYQAEQAGGALMDVGCYCVNFSRALLGSEPTEVHAIAHMHPFGVDDYAAGTLRFGDVTLATFTCGMTVHSDWTTFIAGTEGHLAIENPWLGDGPFTLTSFSSGETEVIETAACCGPYALEMEHFAAVVMDGASPLVTRQDSVGNMQVLDQLRTQVGVPIPE